MTKNSERCLMEVLQAFCLEWHKNQYAGLSKRSWPSEKELTKKVNKMADGTIEDLVKLAATTDALSGDTPNDATNRARLKELKGAYEGLEKVTPIFTTLALSKENNVAYQTGWPLCLVRLVAEHFLPLVKAHHARVYGEPRSKLELQDALTDGLKTILPSNCTSVWIDGEASRFHASMQFRTKSADGTEAALVPENRDLGTNIVEFAKRWELDTGETEISFRMLYERDKGFSLEMRKVPKKR